MQTKEENQKVEGAEVVEASNSARMLQ